MLMLAANRSFSITMKLPELRQKVYKAWRLQGGYPECNVTPENENFKTEVRREFGDLRYRETWIKALARYEAVNVFQERLDADHLEIQQRIIAVIAATQHLPSEQITLDSSFEELGIESIDAINILFALEDDFDINIDNEAAEYRTIRNVVDGVEAYLNQENTHLGID